MSIFYALFRPLRRKPVRYSFPEKRQFRDENLGQKGFPFRPHGQKRMHRDQRKEKIQRVYRKVAVRENKAGYECDHINRKQDDKVQNGQIIRHEKYPSRIRQSFQYRNVHLSFPYV